MADRSLRYVVSAVDKNAASTIGNVAAHGSKAASTIGSAFGKLGPLIGGEVGELAQKLTEHLDNLGEHGGKGLAAKLEVGGAAMLGIGAALTTMGAAEKQSTDQLETAITNSGHSFEQFSGKIDATVGHMEKYGFTAINTKDALTTLTNATHDPATAIKMMGEAADLAATRHISLNSAADMLAKTVGGSTRLYKQFGIVVGTNADGTKNLTAAQAQLAAMLHGQADAAADNFTGRLKALRAEVTDGVASFGEKFGPAITAAGAAMTLLTPVVKGAGSALSALAGKFKASGTAATAAADETAAADAQIVQSNEEAAASGTKTRTGMLGAAAGVGALGLAIGAVVVGGFALSNAIDGTNNEATKMETTFKDTKDALTGLQTQMVNSTGPSAALAASWAKQAVAGTGLVDEAAKAGITVGQLTSAITGNDAQTSALIATWRKSGTLAHDSFAAVWRLHNGYMDLSKAQAAARSETTKSTAALSPLARALGTTNADLATAQRAAAKSASSNAANTMAMRLENNAAGLLSGALDKLNGKTLNVEQANIGFRNAEASVTAAVKQNGKALTDNTQKGRDNRSAILDAISAAQQHAQAIATQTGSTVKATAAYQTDIGALRRHLIAIGLDRDQVQTLISKYGQVPHLVTTKVDADTSVAKAKAQAYISWLESLPSVTIGVDFAANRQSTRNSQVPTRATAGGSDFFAGGRTLIAEREPEIVDLPRGSTITPLSKIPRGGGGGDVVLNVNLPHVGLYSPEAARYFVSHIESWIRSGGGIKGLTY